MPDAATLAALGGVSLPRVPVPATVSERLRQILGKKGYLDSPEDLRAYAYDLFARSEPYAVALPETTEQASEVLRLCSENSIPVTCRGSGTSLAGGAVPAAGGLVLCSARMNRILEVSVTDRLLTAQAGAITGDVQKAAASQGLYYPPNPTSCLYCTIGGNVATNAGGASGAKYGVTRDYLLGMTVVLSNGTVLKLGNRCQKDVAGFDLPRLFCGSEGLLGFITEVTLKLVPQPEEIRTALAYFPGVREAGAVVADVIGRRILPCAMELMDGVFLTTVAEVYGVPCPPGTGAALLIECDGPASVLDAQLSAIEECCRAHAASDVSLARTEEERDVLWKARRGGTAALVRKADVLVTLDYAVPISTLPAALETMRVLAEKCGAQVVTIAHAADGNLHPMVLYSPSDPQQKKTYEDFCRESCAAILQMGGTISGEHGIGLEKKDRLAEQLGTEQIRLANSIRDAFDPKGIMNPGKVL